MSSCPWNTATGRPPRRPRSGLIQPTHFTHTHTVSSSTRGGYKPVMFNQRQAGCSNLNSLLAVTLILDNVCKSWVRYSIASIGGKHSINLWLSFLSVLLSLRLLWELRICRQFIWVKSYCCKVKQCTSWMLFVLASNHIDFQTYLRTGCRAKALPLSEKLKQSLLLFQKTTKLNV